MTVNLEPGARWLVDDVNDVMLMATVAFSPHKRGALKMHSEHGRRTTVEPKPAWWELRYPWETQPPWWRFFERSRFRRMHERIARLEFDLGICRDKYDRPTWYDLPWIDLYGSMM